MVVQRGIKKNGINFNAIKFKHNLKQCSSIFLISNRNLFTTTNKFLQCLLKINT